MTRGINNWKELGSKVAEARKVAQLSQADLGAAVRLDRTAITKIESGERTLDSLELARVARVLRRPIDWFLTAALPAVVSRRAHRETQDESREDALLEEIARDVSLLTELGLLIPPKAPKPFSIDSVKRAETAARNLRRHLGLGSDPVWDLLSVVERAGLYGFSVDLRDESLDGSYLRLDTQGVALVNGATPSGRRRFTLVHELGHHIFADDFSDEWIVGSDGDDRERLINAFVIHFLMPSENVCSVWRDMDGAREPRQATVGLGAMFGVSWSALIGHLRHLSLIDAKVYEQLSRERPTKADYLEGGIALREEMSPPAIPPRYAQAVVRAFKRHKISRSRTLELLRGTATTEDLPQEDQVPVESMRAQFNLD
jgi:Zn-dependent peptidase ImmA (M78 family)/DNA-binding XRE family transcriptional regulator